MLRWITPTGRVVAVLGGLAFLAGWQLGWIELFVFAAGCALLLLFGLPFVIGDSNITITRQVKNHLTPVGEPAPVDLRVTNNSSRPTRPRVITETLNGRRVDFPASALRGGQHQDFVVDPPTGRRSIIELGPARVSKTDPLGLFNRSLGQTQIDCLYVHPRTTSLVPLSGGFAKDLEGPTSDSSPAGDVAFHTIRPYQTGDNHRHVHWMSTARTGELMVRHYVDNRQPSLLVVVDDFADQVSAEAFDVGLQIAGSLMESGRSLYPCTLQVGRRIVLGATDPGTSDELLERLCGLERAGSDHLADSVAAAVDVEPSSSVLLVISGRSDAATLIDAVDRYRRRMNVAIALTGEQAPIVPAAGLRVIQASTLAAFAHVWTRAVR